MDTVYAARLRLEAADRSVPRRTFAIVEQGRARSLPDLLFAAPRVSIAPASELRARSRDLSALQLQLLQTTNRSTRQRLLDRIFTAESRLATVSTELFARTQTRLRQPRSLAALQATLAADEVVLEFALADPVSFCLVITRDSARRQVLGTRAAIDRMADTLLTAIRDRRRVRRV